MGSIKPNVKKETATLEFSNRDEINKANDLEKRSGKTIFEFSKTEMKEVIDRVVKEIRIDINKAIKESFK
jgi:3-oxoacyl-[acyl-carrier-protein] synthase III